MDLFVVGDVHGCLHTFKELLDQHWKPDEERLIQLGDLIDRGNDTPGTLLFAKQLKQRHGANVVFLKGNHEYEFEQHIVNGPNEYWLPQCGYDTLNQLRAAEMELQEVSDWIGELPLLWENEHVLISHAGIAEKAEFPLDEANEIGVLWNRTPLRNVGKLQIIGHTPCKSGYPEYEKASHSWNVDTGAYRKVALSAIRVTSRGEVLEIVQSAVDPRDVSEQD
ncbi:serine/threonine protein phosphatase [Paenibacillus sp. ACRRX]|uniref:metallophosphoesterase family protein n=1 Tax=Paenibacillus sp. ACRRX TaxID=2918206 RepID=UPI001EF733E8|nr:metallophosphoesterase family protein [Paenibacillus sp. ACRRX]MCG7406607.1 serine/threonine protein phosphatase [Paenibacillus sp. ACRRX]